MELAFLTQFKAVGAELCRQRLVSSHGGNLSVREGERMLVTRHGCRLGGIGPDDLVEMGLEPGAAVAAPASMEAPIHRAIYRLTEAKAVVHAHPAFAIALSFATRQIMPVDIEGSVMLGEVPVVGWGEKLGPGQGAEAIARALAGSKAVVVQGHGCFAVGKDLEEAADRVVTLEESCRIEYLAKGFRA